MAEQIKVLFGVNIPGGPWNIVLNVGPAERGRGPLLNFGTPSYLRNGRSYRLEMLCACRGVGALTKTI